MQLYNYGFGEAFRILKYEYSIENYVVYNLSPRKDPYVPGYDLTFGLEEEKQISSVCRH